jgi:CheY-like chemotaxis protein
VASILVIDDDPAVRTTVRLVLERDGHAVTVAADGFAGMTALADGAVDLLIVDLFMPGMDGLETIREVRKHHPALPVIVISGTSLAGPVLQVDAAQMPDYLAMAVKLGAVRSIHKPFKPRDLVGAVRQCLGATEGRQAG